MTCTSRDRLILIIAIVGAAVAGVALGTLVGRLLTIMTATAMKSYGGS